VREFWDPLAAQVSQWKTGERVKAGTADREKSDCPERKLIRTGKFGKFLSCSTYPECKYTKPYIEYVKDVVCPTDGGRVRAMKSKKGAKFFGCENYPNCKWAAWKLPAKTAVADDHIAAE
jgi:DNA topoisomerase-1